MLLNIFDSNVPQFFDASERKPFEDFIDQKNKHYFIFKLKDIIIGAGGYWAETPNEARICWLMVHSDYHKKGVGRQMMNSFEEKIKGEGAFRSITLKTAQKTEKFYQKLGYTTIFFEKDHWAKGLDLYLMEKEIGL